MTVSWPVTMSQAANPGAFLVASSCWPRDSWSRPLKVRAACWVVRYGVGLAARSAVTNWST